MWNYNATDLVFMDIESQSAVNLRAVGGKAYIRDATTRLMCCVFKRGTQLVTWIPTGRLPPGCDLTTQLGCVIICDDVPPIVRGWIADGCTFVAHNAEGFDAGFWAHHVKTPVQWLDTALLCRHAGLPAGLDKASRAIGGEGKSDDKAMKLLTMAKVRNGSVVYPVGTAPLWGALVNYNIQDVLALEHLHSYLSRVPMTDAERDTLRMSGEVNARGVPVNLQFARRLRDAWARSKLEATDHIAEITGGKLNADNIGSVKQVKAYLASLGYGVASLDKRTVDQILENPEKFIEDTDTDAALLMLAVLGQRQAAVRSTVGKLDRLFMVTDADSIVRSTIVYHGAHTGRFSGRDLQPHNFPRGAGLKPAQLAAIVDAPDVLHAAKQVSAELESKAKTKSEKRGASVANVLSTLTRCVIQSRPGKTLVIADFAGVEARGVAWVARCTPMLAVFADPKADIYCDMASKLYRRTITPADKMERFVGKQIVLGCGYSMGADKFDAGCRVFLVDLHAAGTTAEECVQAYRKGYPEIPAVWKAYDNAAKLAVRTGRASNAGRCELTLQGSWMCIRLPSGRVLRYRNARIEKLPAKWDTSKLIEQVVYDTPHGYPKSLYGGILAENIVQAICRDLLCHVLCSVPLPCILHVHDEGVWEVDAGDAEAALTAVCRAMSTVPDWAAGFPLGVEGFTSRVYSKSGLPDSVSQKWVNAAQVQH